MLLLNQTTNQHLNLVTQTPTPFIHCDASYSDTSDNKSSSFDEVNVSALKEPQNTDLTTEEESRNPKSRKRKRAMPSEWKRNDTKLLRNTGHENRTIKRGTEIPE